MSSTDQCQQIAARLRGKVLRRTWNEADSSLNGSSFYEVRRALFLYVDGTFLHEKETFSRVSAAGLSLGGRQYHRTFSGTWSVDWEGNGPVLVLLTEREQRLTFGLRTARLDDVEYVADEPWHRYRIA